jgi:2'-5' RNA ligase
LFSLIEDGVMDQDAGGGRLFFAVLPGAAAATRIFRLAGLLKHAHGFCGELIELERLHVTLFFLGQGHLSESLVRLVCEAAADVGAPPFDVWFDRTISFRGRPGRYPFVLVGGNGLDRLKSFRRLLGVALAKKGLRRMASNEFTPHVTLLYGERDAEEHPVEPIGWTIREFALIHSMNGHARIGNWPLHA